MKTIYFLGILLILGCTKIGKNVTVKGKVLNPITGQGFANVKVFLLKEELKLFGGYKSIKETTTDANGEFEISAYRLSQLDISVQIEQSVYNLGWYQNEKRINAVGNNQTSVTKRKVMHADFHAVEYGEFKYSVLL
jgi:5-hydroxyisourate hydrolase-like protein (transthyretin family)